jgi:hypothetical protein
MYAEQSNVQADVSCDRPGETVADRGAIFGSVCKSMLGLCLAPLGGMAANFTELFPVLLVLSMV